MKKRKIKKNLFLVLLGTAVKGAASCLMALFLLALIESVSTKKKIVEKNKLSSAVSRAKGSVEDKVARWR